MSNLRTAESVSPKHPDKICDRISDAILDTHLTQDPDARAGIDIAGGHGVVFVTGEITSRAVNINVKNIVKQIAGDVVVIEHIANQSPEIAQGVDIGGAGDQGIMVGYACDETPQMLPLETVLSRNLCQFIYNKWPFDGKTQVTLDGDKIVSIVTSFQNAKHDELEKSVKDWLGKEPLAKYDNVVFHINPAGDWNIGGFEADAGLTGRKLIVDNYGPRIPIGGGAFSGKDASKVDRSAAYMARKIAIDYLKNRKAHEVFVRLAYAIGYDQPLEASVIVDGSQEDIKGYDLSPNGITKALDLKKPNYQETACWGHFGHAGFNWEV